MPETTHFQDVDHAKDPSAHIGYLDAASALEVAARWKQRSIDLLGPRPGDHILEVGCGNGDEARAIAQRVAPGGQVTAIDISQRMLDEARRRGADGVTFVQMDAHELRFADQSFDGCRAERTLQHVEDPARVVREMARVLRPGRRVVLGEPDWETLLVSASDVGVTRRIVDHAAESPTHRHGRIGRRLADLLVSAGLQVVALEGLLITTGDFAVADRFFHLTASAELARDAGVVTAQESERWLAELADQGQRGALIVSVGGYWVVGEKN
jgi:SAM-dependent methyltransferase